MDLPLQFKGIFDAGEFGREGSINLQTLLNGIAAVDDR